MSHLKNKSEMLSAAAKLLHENAYYPAVAHSAYYSCYQLLKHIWLYSMGKTELELERRTGSSMRIGSHDFLINQAISYIGKSGKKDCTIHARDVGSKIVQLKKFRTNADYTDTLFDSSKSSQSLSLSNEILPILKKY
jgi:vacuolar-type H+-ATPase catalytic subunit A/Vma1